MQGVTFLAPKCTCVTEHAGSCGVLGNGITAQFCEEARTVVVAVETLTCDAEGSGTCTGETLFDYNGPTINTVTIESLGEEVLGSFRLRIIGENFDTCTDQPSPGRL